MTELSVMMDTWQPALASTPGVSQYLFCSSNLLANVRLADSHRHVLFFCQLVRNEMPLGHMLQRQAQIELPRNAQRRKMSLAWWAWAFKGISRASTGSRASSFWL